MPAGATVYTDQRVTYTRILWDEAHKCAKNQYSAGKRRPWVNALVSVALSDQPLHSVHQVAQLRCCQNGVVGLLRDKFAVGSAEIRGPLRSGHFSSAAEAFLAALLGAHDDDNAPNNLLTGTQLCERARGLLESSAMGKEGRKIRDAADWFSVSSTPCVAWEQLHPLVEGLWAKDKAQGKLIIERDRRNLDAVSKKAYELTPAGVEAARRVTGRVHGDSRVSHSLVEAAIQRGLILLVDNREGGVTNVSSGLLKICEKLKEFGINVETSHLPSGYGDYLFVYRRSTKNGGQVVDYAIPHLIERKSVRDLEESFRDGRWETQQKAMDAVVQTLESEGCRCVKQYVLQGKLKKFKCTCGCEGFGGCCRPNHTSQYSQYSQSSQDDDDDDSQQLGGTAAAAGQGKTKYWASFEYAKQQVEVALPAKGYTLQWLSESKPDLARWLQTLFLRFEGELAGGGMRQLPKMRHRDPSGRVKRGDWEVTLRAGATAIELWTPPPNSGLGRASSAAAVVDDDGCSPSSSVSAGVRAAAVLLSTSAPPAAAASRGTSTASKRRPRKAITQSQMTGALARRGDWKVLNCQCCDGDRSCRGSPKAELLNRLQSALPEEIAKRKRAEPAGWVPQMRSIGFGLLVMLDQQSDPHANRSQSELEQLAEVENNCRANLYPAGLCRAAYMACRSYVGHRFDVAGCVHPEAYKGVRPPNQRGWAHAVWWLVQHQKHG